MFSLFSYGCVELVDHLSRRVKATSLWRENPLCSRGPSRPSFRWQEGPEANSCQVFGQDWMAREFKLFVILRATSIRPRGILMADALKQLAAERVSLTFGRESVAFQLNCDVLNISRRMFKLAADDL